MLKQKFQTQLLQILTGIILLTTYFATARAEETLTVAAYPAVDTIVQEVLPAWKKLHPQVNIKIISRQFNDHNTAMTTALSTSYDLPDVMALEVAYVGRFSHSNSLEDLTQAPYQIQRFTDRFVPYALKQATTSSNAIIAAPTDVGPGTLLYRKDILDKAGVTEADLTRSWDSYIDAGIKIKRRTGAYLMANVRDIKDILIRSDILPGQGIYFDSHAHVLVNEPRFHRAFELAKRVHENQLDARVIPWSNDWTEGFRRGTLATQMTGAWLVSHLSNWLAPDTKGLWRAAQLPGDTWAAYGGTFFAIPKGAQPQHKALAWELIQLLTLNSAQQLAAFKTHDAFPALPETYQDEFFEQPIPFLGDQKARLIWRIAVQHIQAVAVHKQDSFAEEVINSELDKVTDQNKDIDVALADAQRLLTRRALR